KTGGELVIDFYEKRSILTFIHAKYILRPWTKRMSHERLLRWIDRNVDFLMTAYKTLHRLRLGILTRFLPICDIYQTIPKQISGDKLREWVVLDTFDMFSPTYDSPKSIDSVSKMVTDAGLTVTFADHVIFSNNRAAVVRAVREV
ncbi:MAG: class I SAM-dependent methyltransferase, partial [Proteobacteria bacterium]|nr:class I SAM-dependent methyltransferase [Pseudomonadota bacterium]